MTIILSTLRCNILNLRSTPESVCHSLKTRKREVERRERVLTSALTSSTSLACDHTVLLSYSHWTTEKQGKQWAGGKWSGQSGMLCRGRVRESERASPSKAGRGGREERWEEREEVGVRSLVPLTETRDLEDERKEERVEEKKIHLKQP